MLDDYTNAVDEYRKAMKLNDAWEAVKEQGVGILKYAIPGAATATQSRARSADREEHPCRTTHVPQSARCNEPQPSTRRHQKAQQVMPQKPVKPHSANVGKPC